MNKFGTGWKTNTGGVALIVMGIAGLIVNVIDPESAAAVTPEVAVAMISNGLIAIGLGHKAERVYSANEETQKRVMELRQPN